MLTQILQDLDSRLGGIQEAGGSDTLGTNVVSQEGPHASEEPEGAGPRSSEEDSRAMRVYDRGHNSYKLKRNSCIYIFVDVVEAMAG